ncbi:hypothetical protein LSAT2_000837 [Lamellibrachia satsuma]|nr:hypothetical protein LSAT2_000837 [Lamellibrachia satsuma]
MEANVQWRVCCWGCIGGLPRVAACSERPVGVNKNFLGRIVAVVCTKCTRSDARNLTYSLDSASGNEMTARERPTAQRPVEVEQEAAAWVEIGIAHWVTYQAQRDAGRKTQRDAGRRTQLEQLGS